MCAGGMDFPRDATWPALMFSLAETSHHLGDRGLAAVLYSMLEPIAHQVGTLTGVVCLGSYGYYAGLLAATLGRWDDAERHFAHAEEMHERLGARPSQVRTRRAHAAMLLERGAPGDAARAAALIATALPEAETLGMARELLRLRALGERAAKP